MATSDLNARSTTTIDEGVVRVEVSLRDQTAPIEPGYLEPPLYQIEPDEHVRVAFRDQTLDLLAGRDAYIASFAADGEVAGDEAVTVALDRGGDDTTMVVSTVPPGFTLSAAPTTSSQPVDVTWSPIASDAMHWRGMACIPGDHFEGPVRVDTGVLEFPAGVLDPAGETVPCPVSLTFARTRIATPSSTFASTYVSVERYATVDFEIQP